MLQSERCSDARLMRATTARLSLAASQRSGRMARFEYGSDWVDAGRPKFLSSFLYRASRFVSNTKAEALQPPENIVSTSMRSKVVSEVGLAQETPVQSEHSSKACFNGPFAIIITKCGFTTCALSRVKRSSVSISINDFVA